ncbi:hypothetical protein [Aquimarina sp. SS2-1]|uniref:hypothetical protein n=1 Tax=Aquimarina besae TaxID=3342247 RepID=UPI003671F107
MKDSPKEIIRDLHLFIDRHRIDIIKYNLKSSFWWKGRKAILTRRYTNFCGEVIEKEAMVCILDRMQFIRFEEVIHCGMFFVYDLNTGVIIGGIDCKDLLLTGQRIKVKNQLLFR